MPNSIENKEELKLLKTLVRSQRYQLEKLNDVNKNIKKLNNELNQKFEVDEEF